MFGSVEPRSYPPTTRDSLGGLPFDSPTHPSESAGLLSRSDSGIRTMSPYPDDIEAGYSTPNDVIEMQEWVSF